tara:strand:+ start:95 stop:562 length:468 start_codon:yes stop_codon:yes gene_type:complete
MFFAKLFLKPKKTKWKLNKKCFKNFKYIPQKGKRKKELIDKIRLEHYQDYHKVFKGLFIAHVYELSGSSDYKYDVYIYITGENSHFISEIQRADFMFGPAWNNHVINSQKSNEIFGLRVSTSEPFLCTCCVTLKDRRRLFMDRFIDFELDKMLLK